MDFVQEERSWGLNPVGDSEGHDSRSGGEKENFDHQKSSSLGLREGDGLSEDGGVKTGGHERREGREESLL